MYEIYELLIKLINKGYQTFDFGEIPKIVNRDVQVNETGNVVGITMLEGAQIEQRFLDPFVFQITAKFEILGMFDNIEHGKLIGKQFMMILMNYQKLLDPLTQSDVIINVREHAAHKVGSMRADFAIYGEITRIMNYYKEVPPAPPTPSPPIEGGS